ncbi:electron transport complex subunit RsxC [Rheinheimera sp. UJ63]|uniref:electron transport complex subunit RsxC n=1 Tax=Rheinheimera sp. UJ63 TaxID=2910157 RepID=UPI001F1898CF|nr:electron transport complex subunit RsxC [Rheinheimera sp. UJ63]MCF4009397.1 electron transport complex subunit RsxC [Rheinheimera sp. UJ63]
MPSLFQQIQAGALWDFHGGVHPPTRKAVTSEKPIISMSLPERLYIPLRQHIGVAGQLLVEVGERVLKGQALTAADNSMTVPVHAPTSGMIIAITDHTSPHPSALPESVIVIEPDGLEEWREREPLNFATADTQTLLERIQDSGIAGMGGAGFPTHIKAGLHQPVDYLIINAVECEPYITADDALMQEAPTTIVKGIDILCKLLNPKAVLIGIEADKPIAAAGMRAACSQREHYYVREVPVKYPSGGEKQLIQLLTNKEVPAGRRPADIGIVMQNIGTAFAIAQAVLDDHPLISRIVTVTGETLQRPQNVQALIGTPVAALLDFCGYQVELEQKVIMGGPMMGFTLPDLAVPVVKTTNCILAPSHTELPNAGPELDCIRCSACADACPATLLPQQLLWYSKAKDHDKLKEYNLADCIECGACAYVCPSEIPLVQYYRIAKAEIREQQREALKAEQAKARFEARNARLEAEKQARLAKNQQLAAARQQSQQQNAGSNTVAAALERIKAKQQNATETAQRSHADIVAEREVKKQQARAYQAQQAAATHTDAESGAQSQSASQNLDATATDPRQAAVAAAIARAKARQQQHTTEPAQTAQSRASAPAVTDSQATQNHADKAPSQDDPRKAAVAAALARAKARKQQQGAEAEQNHAIENNAATAASREATADKAPSHDDPRKAAVAAALARAKARKQQQGAEAEQNSALDNNGEAAASSEAAADKAPSHDDPRKAAVAAALARAKARKQQQGAEAEQNSALDNNGEAAASSEAAADEAPSQDDPRKAAVAAALARAKARKQQAAADTRSASEHDENAQAELAKTKGDSA